MSQSAMHKVAIRNKAPGTISTGANTELTIDGIPMRCVSFVKIEIKARNVAKMTMEMYVDIEDIQLDTPLEVTKIRAVDKIKNWVLGQYNTRFIK